MVLTVAHGSFNFFWKLASHQILSYCLIQVRCCMMHNHMQAESKHQLKTLLYGITLPEMKNAFKDNVHHHLTSIGMSTPREGISSMLFDKNGSSSLQ